MSLAEMQEDSLTRPSSQIRNSWLRFAPLHSIANYYSPLMAALCAHTGIKMKLFMRSDKE